MRAKTSIDNIRIATPCPATWERMAGDERVRHCSLCALNVYNFAELTRTEIVDLLQRTEGRVCARLFRRADGTLLTRDCPTGLQRIRARVSRWRSALMAALLSASGFVTGCATTVKTLVSPQPAPVAAKEDPVVVLQKSVLEGLVVNESGECLPGALLFLREKSSGAEHAVLTDAEGRFTTPLVASEAYDVEVVNSSQTVTVRDLRVSQRDHVTTSAASVAFSITVGILVGGEDDSVMASGFATTSRFSKRLLDKLPVF